MMKQKPSIDYLKTRIKVDIVNGIVFWIDATKHHANLNGREAGTSRLNQSGKAYWHVKINCLAIKRSHIVFLFSRGTWPTNQIDHINGDSLDDRAENLREATHTENAWNHRARKKKSSLPMGIRILPSGKFQARIACNKVKHSFGPFETVDEAQHIYKQKRKELFGEYSGY